MTGKTVFVLGSFILGVTVMLFAQTAPQGALVDSAQLLQDLKTLSADDMQGRQVGTPGGGKARAFVVERFKASGIQPIGASYEMPFKFSGRGANAAEREGVNVVGTIEGTRTPRRYIVVSAHYDHIGVRNGEVFNGADAQCIRYCRAFCDREILLSAQDN